MEKSVRANATDGFILSSPAAKISILVFCYNSRIRKRRIANSGPGGIEQVLLSTLGIAKVVGVRLS
jgi:hypothetical protein